MKLRKLLYSCIIGIAVSLLILASAVYELLTFPSAATIPSPRALSPESLPGRNPEMEALFVKWHTETTASIESLRTALASAVTLAKHGMQERAILGAAFAIIFALLAFQIWRLAWGPEAGC